MGSISTYFFNCCTFCFLKVESCRPTFQMESRLIIKSRGDDFTLALSVE